MSTDSEWEHWGARDPYFGVLTLPKFRSGAITAEAKDTFFSSGRDHVSYVLDVCRRTLDPAFAPQDVLDFGCGVGRLVVPFASVAPRVVGMDISPSMLHEARRNCDERDAGHVELVLSDDVLSAASGDFDLVHSCIVLQHLEVERGRKIFAALVAKVRSGGVGALHVTFAWDIHANSFGQPPTPEPATPVPPPGLLAPIKSSLKRLLVPAPARAATKPPEAEIARDPEMQMNYYNLSELMFVLQQAGVGQVHTEFTDHGGALGVFLFFKKPASIGL